MTTSKRAADRPLSPHLGVWRWSSTMTTSIFHRVSGVANAMGTVLLAWWLVAVASGPEAYATFAVVASHPLGQLVLFGFTVSLTFHLLNGIRHLFWDGGKGFALGASAAWSWLSMLGSVALAIGIWVWGYSMMGGL